MRVLGLNLLIALALFGFAVARNSERQAVALAYREHIEVDGDAADASLRIDGCTMPWVDARLHREDGRWEVGLREWYFDYEMPPCYEGGQIPPPELAWTWQESQWR